MRRRVFGAEMGAERVFTDNADVALGMRLIGAELVYMPRGQRPAFHGRAHHLARSAALAEAGDDGPAPPQMKVKARPPRPKGYVAQVLLPQDPTPSRYPTISEYLAKLRSGRGT